MKHILLLEDNTLHYQQIIKSLEEAEAGYSVVGFTHTNDLLQYLGAHKPCNLLLYNINCTTEVSGKLTCHPLVKNQFPHVCLLDPQLNFLSINIACSEAFDVVIKTPENISLLPFTVKKCLFNWQNNLHRVIAENKLTETATKYTRISENVNDVIWEMNNTLSMFLFVSASIKGFLGYSAEEFLSLKPSSVIRRESLHVMREARLKALNHLYSGHKPREVEYHIEIAFIHKDGSTRWGEVTGFLIENAQNRVVAVSGVVKNITRQKEALSKLEIREAYFETLIREAPLAIVLLDNNDRVRQVNKHFITLFGYDENECIGHQVNDLIVPDQYKDEGNNLTGQASRGENIYHETVRKTKSGKLVEVLILGKPIMLRNSKLGVIGIYQDISQRKMAEVATRVASIKQQFLANMSHEIRSPMTGIMGMIDLLQKTSLDEQQALFVDVIKKSSDGLLAIVNDILDLSKIEAGKMIIRPRNFNLRKMAGTLFSLFNALARKQNISFFLDYDKQLPGFIVADENRIVQIITNLLSNAIKFTTEGSVTLKFRWIGRKNEEHLIEISVEDTGIGIEEDDKEKLFKMFSQLDASDTRNFDGAGLGLSISQRLAELMNASIEVVSSPGEGSCFKLLLHAPEGRYIPDVLPDESGETKSDMPVYNVLLTEDKKTNQMVISMMLQEIGCNVAIASNGLEAIEKINHEKFDFIFMDIQMPVMDGLTAVKELRRQYPRNNPPYIIGLSAKAMEGDAEYHISEGMDDYLTKPVTSEVLRQCMLRWSQRNTGQRNTPSLS